MSSPSDGARDAGSVPKGRSDVPDIEDCRDSIVSDRCCSAAASRVEPVCTVPAEKLGAVCSGPVHINDLFYLSYHVLQGHMKRDTRQLRKTHNAYPRFVAGRLQKAN